MRFNICTNIDNGVGLEADYRLLKGLLESWGHRVNGVHFKRIDPGIPRADVNIFLETLASAIFPLALQNWLIPNQEWFAPCDNTNIIPCIDKILCKTHDAVRIFTNHYGPEKVSFLGFESRDLYDPSIPRERKFLHIAGQSRYKNSQAVAYLFAKCYDDGEPKDRKDLIFVGAYPEEFQFAIDHKNCRYIQRATDAEIRQLLNESLFHVIPSGAEGWGHVIHEALGVGAVVITTNFPPMNEFEGVAADCLCPYQRVIPELAATRALVGAFDVRVGVEKAWALGPARIAEIQTQARQAFLFQRDRFRTTLKNLIDGVR